MRLNNSLARQNGYRISHGKEAAKVTRLVGYELTTQIQPYSGLWFSPNKKNSVNNKILVWQVTEWALELSTNTLNQLQRTFVIVCVQRYVLTVRRQVADSYDAGDKKR